jgi:hypothetical protein
MDIRFPNRRRGLAAARLAAALAAAVAFTAFANEPRAGAQGAACEQRSASTDPAACRQESGAAAQAGRQGDLTGANQPLERNGEVRCGALPSTEQVACRARLSGQGGDTTTTGSVQGGGILREHRETVEGPPGTPTGVGAAGAGAGAAGSGAAGGSSGSGAAGGQSGR